MKITLAITGASGSIYAKRLAMKLIESSKVTLIYIVLSETAKKVSEYELGKDGLYEVLQSEKVKELQNGDFFSPIASGSNCADAMIIVPCSMGMIGRVANGISNDLISRAADVMIKEEKKIIFVPRETPLSAIHLKNLTALKEAGATILPATPSFYSKPKTIDELIDTIVDRILTQIGVQNNNYLWGENVL